MWNDVRFALRTLRHNPAFTIVAVLSVALGIGANTSVFSLLDQVLFRLLPVPEPERLVVFHSEARSQGWSTSDNSQTVFSYPMYKDLRDRSAVFTGVIARASAPVSLFYGGHTERASAELVSGNFFQVLGVKALLGRTFTQDDDGDPGAHPLVVLAHSYWVQRFGADPALLSQKVIVNGHPMIVVGVAPSGFHGVLTGHAPDLLVPIAMKRQITPTWDGLDDRTIQWLNIFARLKPGIPMEKAEAATQTVFRPILQNELAQLGRMRNKQAEERFLAQKIELLPAAQGINPLRTHWQTALVALMAMVGLVLLIACANLAGLMLARAAERQREIVIRLAIGASRLALVRQLLFESLVVAVGGGLLGLLVAEWTTGLLLRLLPQDAAGGWLSAQIDLRLLGFALLLSLATGLLFGLAPALQATRLDLTPALKSQTATLAVSGSQMLFRRVLVVAQVSLSLVLLAGAGLFARSLYSLKNVDLGFRTEKLVTFLVDPKLNGYTAPRAFAFYRDLQQRLSALPGVRAVGAANPGPLTGNQRGGNITVEGYQPKQDEYVGSSMHAASPGYFRAIGIPLLAGRDFTERDGPTSPKAVIVNEAFVKRYVGRRNPLGRRMCFGGGNRVTLDREIVGVVGNNKHSSLREPVGPVVFFPYTQDARLDRLSFYVRAESDADRIALEIRRVVQQLDANLPVSDMKPVEIQVEDSIYRDRLIAMLSGAFAVLATLLAAIGLYGVFAYMVARRTAEIGIRMALGALPRNVLGMVMRDVALLVGLGIGIGLPTALALSSFIGSQLFGIKANDPVIFAGAAASLALVALASGFIPGRRAARVDPMNALRQQ